MITVGSNSGGRTQPAYPDPLRAENAAGVGGAAAGRGRTRAEPTHPVSCPRHTLPLSGPWKSSRLMVQFDQLSGPLYRQNYVEDDISSALRWKM